MAESYRGLTIQIGGDTTKLSQALKTATAAAKATDSELRKLSDAVKLDPSSLQAANLQMGAMASSAAATAMKLSTLNEAIKQVGQRQFDGQSVEELSKNTKNAQMNAELALASYNKLTDSLGKMNTEISYYSQETARAASIDFGSKIKESFRQGAAGAEVIANALKDLPSLVIQPTENAVDSFASKLEGYGDRFQKLTADAQRFKEEMDAATGDDKEKATSRFEKTQKQIDNLLATVDKVVDRFAKFDGKVFNFENDDTSIDDLQKAFASMPDAIRPSQAAINDFILEVIRLKGEWENAETELEKATIIAQFQQAQSEATKLSSTITSLSRAMADMKLPSDLMRSLYEQTEGIKALSNAYTYHMNMGKQMADAYKADPTNLEALASAQEHFAAATLIATEKSSEQQAVLDKYEAERSTLEAFVETGKSAQKQLNEMAVAHAHAQEEVSRLEGEEAHLVETIQNLVGSESEMAKALDAANGADLDADLAKNEELVKRVENLRKVREALAAAREEENKFAQGEETAKKAKEWGEAKDKVVVYTAEATKARIEGEKLAQTDITPKYDDDIAKRMESAFKQIEAVAATSVGMDKQLAEIKNFDKAVEEAVKRVKTFDDALKADPGDEMFKSARAEAIADATKLATQEQLKLNAAIEAMKLTGVDEFALKTGTVSQKLEEAKTAFNTAVTSMRGYETALTKVTTELNKLQQKPLSTQTKEDKERIAELTAEMGRLQQAIKKVQQEGDEAFDNLIKEQNSQSVVTMADRYNELIRVLAELEKIAAETHQQDATPKIDEAAFMQVVDRIAQAARRMASEIVQASDQIDAAYRDMRKTVNGTEEDFVRLRDAAIEYSKNSFTSADQMLEMQALGGQLGVAVENLEQFGKIASNLDIATDLDAETVALKLGQISNILGLDIEGMQGFSDALVRLGNNMPAQESAIMAVAQRFGAVAATASFSGDEILGWSAAIAATGQRSEAAATAISNTVSGIEQAVANGGSDLKQFAAIAGMSSDEFVASWKEGPTEVLRAFIEGLKNLKDNNTSAVAALENMGITGVRQQQTLLALTQTIDSLDEALAMSHNAWEGVNDQWGQSGDAANEAQKKAEGFSGALQILKNNVENLAASLGDGMVRPMHIIADAIGIVTDVLNSMPQPVKEIVVALGAAGIAFSALTPMLNYFTGGMANLIKTASETSTITGFIASLTGFDKVGAVFKDATANASGFGAVLSGPVVLGITAVVGGLTLLYGYLNDWQEKQDMFVNATTGMTTAINSMKEAYDNYIPDSAIMSVTELRDRTNEVIEAQSSLATKMSEQWEDVGVAAAMVDEYANKIVELSEKNALTVDEQKELAAAVQAYNDLTGSTISIVNSLTGDLDTSTDAILANAEAWKKRAESEAAFEMYKDVVKQRIKNELELAEANKVLEKAEQDARNAGNDLYGGFSSASIKVSEAKAEVDRLTDAIEADYKTQEQLVGHMQDSEQSITMVRNALALTEDGLARFDALTIEEQAQVAAAFKGTGESALRALAQIEAARAGIAAGTSDALEASSKATAKSAAEEYKRSSQIEYDQKKAAYDAAYNAAKRSLDNEYDLQKKAYDAQYSALKKNLDAKYGARKRAYDKQYSQRKRRLDAELDQIKEANDKKLAEVKRANDAEERAYKNETDAYLHQLEVRYKATVKTLEDETDAKVKAIDEQIRALKGQTTAEQNAVKEMKEDDKLATLQKDIDNAKSRRKREEAEKKYNMYLAEVQADRRERERKEQIEELELQKKDLKDELSTRKDAVKLEYDEEKYLYKTMRDEKLEAIKVANDIEEQTLKSSLDAQEEARKTANDIALENLKTRQSEKLEALKSSHQDQLDAVKLSQQDQLDAIKQSHQIELENMKADHDAKLKELKREHDAEYARIKANEDSKTGAQDSGNKTRAEHQERDSAAINGVSDRYLTAMERRMQEAGDKNIKASDSANSTINKNTDSKLSELAMSYKTRGDEMFANLSSAFETGKRVVGQNAEAVAMSAQAPFTGLSASAYVWGWDMLVEFNNGLVKAWNEGGVMGVIEQLGKDIKDFLGFSVPKKGPLSDADKWAPDMVYLLADGIKSKKHVLIDEVRRMSDAMEEAFDPTMTVDAAYEALDTISKNKSISLGSVIETSTAPSVTINLSMNLSDVSIRDDTDIERLAKVVSQEMATQATRQLAGRLG